MKKVPQPHFSVGSVAPVSNYNFKKGPSIPQQNQRCLNKIKAINYSVCQTKKDLDKSLQIKLEMNRSSSFLTRKAKAKISSSKCEKSKANIEISKSRRSYICFTSTFPSRKAILK